MGAFIQNAEEMRTEAARFVGALLPGARATLLALSGDLGAGKTTFVQGIAQALGVEEQVTSPTFVIMKIYPVGKPVASNGADDLFFKHLVHMDAYRLKGKEHLRVLGWEALLADPGNLICIEWPEKIHDGIPADAVGIRFRYSGGNEREIVYEKDR